MNPEVNVSVHSQKKTADFNYNISILSWFRFLLKRSWIIFLFCVIGGILGIIYAITQKPKYEARLTFALVENSGGGLNGVLSLAADFGINVGNGKDIFAGENILSIITSKRVVEGVLMSIDTLPNNNIKTLAQEYFDINDKKTAYKKFPSLQNISFPVGIIRDRYTYHQDSIISLFYDEITKNAINASKPDKKLNIFELKFESKNERFSKIFAERLLDQTTYFYTELRTKRNRETLAILEQRAGSLKGTAYSAISNSANIQDANMNPAFMQQNAVLQKQHLDATVYGNAYSEIFKTLEIARYNYLNEIPLLQVIDQARYPMKKIKLGRLKTGLIAGFTLGILSFFVLVTYFYVSNSIKYEKQLQYN